MAENHQRDSNTAQHRREERAALQNDSQRLILAKTAQRAREIRRIQVAQPHLGGGGDDVLRKAFLEGSLLNIWDRIYTAPNKKGAILGRLAKDL